MRSLPHVTAGLVAVVLLAAACTQGAEAACEQPIPGVRSGVCLGPPSERPPAPGTAVPVLGEPSKQLGIPDLEGKVVVLNFWASWCGPCRSEQPDLNAAYETLQGSDIAFLGVNIQEPGPAEANALAHEREFDIPYPSLYDPTNAYAAAYKGVGPRSIPSTILLDRQGRVAARLFGEIRGPEEVVVLAQMLLQEPGNEGNLGQGRALRQISATDVTAREAAWPRPSPV